MHNHWVRYLLYLLLIAGLVSACTPEMLAAPLAQVTSTAAPTTAPQAAAPSPAPTNPAATAPTAPASAASPAPTQKPTLALAATVLPDKTQVPAMNDVPMPLPLDAFSQSQVDQAKADLAKHLAIQSSQIELISFSSVTWPDSSLGCPKPGMAYAQVMVDGYRIRLKASGQVYEYHGAGGKPAALCQ
jgi:hypothetical protein